MVYLWCISGVSLVVYLWWCISGGVSLVYLWCISGVSYGVSLVCVCCYCCYCWCISGGVSLVVYLWCISGVRFNRGLAHDLQDQAHSLLIDTMLQQETTAKTETKATQQSLVGGQA